MTREGRAPQHVELGADPAGADTVVKADVTSPNTPVRRWIARALEGLAYRYGLVGVWVVLIAVFSAMRPSTFLTASNFAVMFGSQASAIILALALVVTLSVAEFDLSVASTMGLCATLIAVLNGLHQWNVALSVLVGLASGLAVGALNGWLVVYVGIDGIIVTLGMATLLVGIAIWASSEQAIGGVSSGLTSAMNQHVLGISASFFYALAIAAVIWYVLRRTPLGRHMLFIGHNREVARLVGIHVARVRFGAYVVGGLVAAASGVVAVGVGGGFLADTSQSLLLPAFAAAFLGAAVVIPGRFNAWGTVIAILFLNTGITGIELVGLSGTSWISQVFYGGALVVAVTVSGVISRQRRAKAS